MRQINVIRTLNLKASWDSPFGPILLSRFDMLLMINAQAPVSTALRQPVVSPQDPENRCLSFNCYRMQCLHA